MKALVTALALVATIGAANAQARNPNNGGFATSIGTAILSIPYLAPRSSGGIINERRATEIETQERNERIAEWETYCNPTLSEPNANGVRRYVYAKPGCEFGRSKD